MPCKGSENAGIGNHEYLFPAVSLGRFRVRDFHDTKEELFLEFQQGSTETLFVRIVAHGVAIRQIHPKELVV
jgi:hypothetical protein